MRRAAQVKLYFDTCTLQRPLDDRSQLRVAIESEAVLNLLAACAAGSANVVSSDILLMENERNREAQRKEHVELILENARSHISVDEKVKKRANLLVKRGFKSFDALHIACAESGKVDYLCTCDDRLLKKSRAQKDLAVKVATPLELAKVLLP